VKSVVKNSSVAVVDVGSNSIKLLVAAHDASGRVAALAQRTFDTRISAGLGGGEPSLGEAGMAAGLDAIQALLALAAEFEPVKTILVATSAVRDAANGADFRSRVFAATRHELRILSGDEEAGLIGRGLLCDPALAALRDFYVFDLGGGSLECLAFRDRHIAQALSLPLGCVRLTEKFFPAPDEPLTPGACSRVALHVRDALKSSGFRFALGPAPAVFTGGSVAAVRAITGAMHHVAFADTPSFVSADTLSALIEEVMPLPLAARQKIPGLPAARADVFPAALITMLAVAELGPFRFFHHSLHNLRWGLAAEALGPAP
jgi:exopolyphosphatase/guanosine-5'-triphosphate,3'-diphosphate pyrophosphatase